jgi:hypothetical protein
MEDERLLPPRRTVKQKTRPNYFYSLVYLLCWLLCVATINRPAVQVNDLCRTHAPNFISRQDKAAQACLLKTHCCGIVISL